MYGLWSLSLRRGPTFKTGVLLLGQHAVYRVEDDSEQVKLLVKTHNLLREEHMEESKEIVETHEER